MEMSQQFDPPQPLLSLTAEKRYTLVPLLLLPRQTWEVTVLGVTKSLGVCSSKGVCPAGGEMHMLEN